MRQTGRARCKRSEGWLTSVFSLGDESRREAGVKIAERARGERMRPRALDRLQAPRVAQAGEVAVQRGKARDRRSRFDRRRNAAFARARGMNVCGKRPAPD